MTRKFFDQLTPAAQDAARRAWRSSNIGRLIEGVRRDYRRDVRDAARLEQALEEMQRHGVSSALSSLQGESFNGLISEVACIGSKAGAEKLLLNELLRQLGPAGQIIRAIATAVSSTRPRDSSGDADVDAARRYLEAMGRGSMSPPNSARSKDMEAAAKLLREHGFEGNLAAKTIRQPSQREQQQLREQERRQQPPAQKRERKPAGTEPVDVDMGTGNQRFSADHPIVTRQMVEVPTSSNVWSFGYLVDKWRLYVRYDNPKTDEQPSKRPGPLYAHANVPPDAFLRMLKAESKGNFIWDNVRVRGTVSGHKYDYRLVAVRGGIVPRKATLKPGGEWYIQRKVSTISRSGKRKTLVSRASAPATAFTRSPGR